jgi:hypothetical protein
MRVLVVGPDERKLAETILAFSARPENIYDVSTDMVAPGTISDHVARLGDFRCVFSYTRVPEGKLYRQPLRLDPDGPEGERSPSGHGHGDRQPVRLQRRVDRLDGQLQQGRSLRRRGAGDHATVKEYPSVPRATGQVFREIHNAYVFDKLDGSSMRSEWAAKRGWFKHGRRHGLVDDSNIHLASVPELFQATLAEDLARIAESQRWKHLIVFYEFWGDQSLAGQHVEGDPKRLTVFDAAADKKGILNPGNFRQAFEGQVDTARFLGQVNWTRGYVERVWRGEVEGITSEGVVAKAGIKHDIIRAKAKTQAWVTKIMEIHGAVEGKKIVES